MSHRASSAAIVLLTTLFIVPSSAEWLEFGAGCPEGLEPLTFHNITLDDLISFDVELQGLRADTVEQDSIKYLRFGNSPGTVPMDCIGYPELPMITCFVIVPDGSDLDLTHSAGSMSSMECLPVYPAPLDSTIIDILGIRVEEFFRKDSAAYASEEWYPSQIVEISGEFMLRDQRVAVVDVYPVQYLASGDSLRVWSDIEVMINFTGPDPVWNEEGLGYYDLLIGNRLLGYEPDYAPIDSPSPEVERHTDTTVEPDIDPDYVIIVASGLDGTWIDSFADHRSDLNLLDVLIAGTDDIMTGYGIGSAYLTPDILRDYTETLWAWSPPGDRPTYLLLIGDHEEPEYGSEDWFLPTWTEEVDAISVYERGNDEWLVCFGDARDEYGFPDMMVGRLPARTLQDIAGMLDNIIDYEAEASWPPSPSLDWRRNLTRLSGTDQAGDHDGWDPLPGWTDDLRTWCGYGWDNYYCGDGDDIPPNPDGSSLSSKAWVKACTNTLAHGSQIALYTDHGSVHYFECAMDLELGNYAGRPDSTFDDEDVRSLCSGGGKHGFPFVLLMSCGQGTYNWTEEQQYAPGSEWWCWSVETGHEYDFGVDCFAEELMKNHDGGAIGVFGSSWTCTVGDGTLANEILRGLLYYGHTTLGAAVSFGRLEWLPSLWWEEEGWDESLPCFNLLGDPAVDIGDRVKFRDRCDLVISPEDLAINRYPTRSVNDREAWPELQVTVRNIGAVASGAFDVDLRVKYGGGVWNFTESCGGLYPGEEETLSFEWVNAPQNIYGKVSLRADADPANACPDSWLPNNKASTGVAIIDMYPNEDGWPVRLPGSVKSVPCLVDLDGDGDLEIVVACGNMLLAAYDPDDVSTPMWLAGPYMFTMYSQELSQSIPVCGNVCGTELPEVIIDGMDSLFVFDGLNGELLYSFPHPEEDAWSSPHTVCLVDLVQEGIGQFRNEIVVVLNETLFVFRVQNDELTAIDSADLPVDPNAAMKFTWACAADLDGTYPDEIIVSGTFREIGAPYESWLYLYDFATGQVVTQHLANRDYRGVPAVGELDPGETMVALSSLKSDASGGLHPAMIIDPDNMSIPIECEISPLDANAVLCCIMADWHLEEPGLDRIIAPAENQVMVWDEGGILDINNNWPAIYSDDGSERPPFPALGDLDDTGQEDLLIATREGWICAYNNAAYKLAALGFPYQLPSEVNGGFAIADIDNDGYVEVVFGTMDNYLHVWELGECSAGYTPWPQCQHDVARTGVLEE